MGAEGRTDCSGGDERLMVLTLLVAPMAALLVAVHVGAARRL